MSGHERSTHVPVCSMARILQRMYARDRLLPSPDGGLARLLLNATLHPATGNVTHHHKHFWRGMISLGIRTLHYQYGTFTIEEYDGHSMWPGGDPVPTSDETLVYLLSRDNVKELYECS